MKPLINCKTRYREPDFICGVTCQRPLIPAGDMVCRIQHVFTSQTAGTTLSKMPSETWQVRTQEDVFLCEIYRSSLSSHLQGVETASLMQFPCGALEPSRSGHWWLWYRRCWWAVSNGPSLLLCLSAHLTSRYRSVCEHVGTYWNSSHGWAWSRSQTNELLGYNEHNLRLAQLIRAQC